jgi:hypothetical protein
MDGQMANMTQLLQILIAFTAAAQITIQQKPFGGNPSMKSRSCGGSSLPNLYSSLKVETKVEIFPYDDQMDIQQFDDLLRQLDSFIEV